MSARRNPIAPPEAPALLGGVDILVATRGRKVVEIDLRSHRPAAGQTNTIRGLEANRFHEVTEGEPVAQPLPLERFRLASNEATGG